MLVERTMNNPKHNLAVLKLLESFAQAKNNDFNEYYQKYKDNIRKVYNDNLILEFLLIFKSIINNDLDEVKVILSPIISPGVGEAKMYSFEGLWSLDAARNYISRLETTLQKEYLRNVIEYYSGAIGGNALSEFFLEKEISQKS